MADKKKLRRHFKEVRKSAESDLKNSVITAKILADEKIRSADTVLLYASFGSEVDTWNIAQNLLFKDVRIAYPKCGENNTMTFHIVSELNQLDDAYYGICEPDISLPQPEITDRTVCIVPALAFTEKGGRLGYGGGYYDRFLAEHPEIYTIGLAYEDCIAESLPLAEYDIKIKSVITEERTIICNE
ncbi:MAG: 5-formyltetrahydrofolate cyclo-ligase [Ruminococcus flavefaciens]|nr:5-formyltetrahydrofolate cyclo-ligase [Ruminococcus flavefaciens]MCM1229892.1 5-formyltetrahydrofolate cyclo-ligase [Ruminococcus flavefaciens]